MRRASFVGLEVPEQTVEGLRQFKKYQYHYAESSGDPDSPVSVFLLEGRLDYANPLTEKGGRTEAELLSEGWEWLGVYVDLELLIGDLEDMLHDVV